MGTKESKLRSRVMGSDRQVETAVDLYRHIDGKPEYRPYATVLLNRAEAMVLPDFLDTPAIGWVPFIEGASEGIRGLWYKDILELSLDPYHYYLPPDAYLSILPYRKFLEDWCFTVPDWQRQKEYYGQYMSSSKASHTLRVTVPPLAGEWPITPKTARLWQALAERQRLPLGSVRPIFGRAITVLESLGFASVDIWIPTPAILITEKGLSYYAHHILGVQHSARYCKVTIPVTPT
jgi:hypothetical protein